VRELLLPLNLAVDYLAGNILEGYGFANNASITQEEQNFFLHGYTLINSLDDLSESPRWPQWNARNIRKTSNALSIAIEANVERCADEQIYLSKADSAELLQLYFALVDLTHRYSIQEARKRRISEKREELTAHAISQGAAR
jgi:hypothetical protein